MRELLSQRGKMGFDFESDLVFERLDSGMFEREEAIPNHTGKLYRMRMLLLFRKSELLARGVLPHFYPPNDRVACSSFVKSTLPIFQIWSVDNEKTFIHAFSPLPVIGSSK